MPHAEVQFVDFRHLRPAAPRDDAVVSFYGLFGDVRGLRRQRRRGRLGHVDGARGLIEGLAEAAALPFAHQRIERRIGSRSPRRRAGGRKSRHAGRAAQEPAPIRISPGPLDFIIHGNVIRSVRPPKLAALLSRPRSRSYHSRAVDQRRKVPPLDRAYFMCGTLGGFKATANERDITLAGLVTLTGLGPPPRR